jgi:hypothetical protein
VSDTRSSATTAPNARLTSRSSITAAG